MSCSPDTVFGLLHLNSKPIQKKTQCYLVFVGCGMLNELVFFTNYSDPLRKQEDTQKEFFFGFILNDLSRYTYQCWQILYFYEEPPVLVS